MREVDLIPKDVYGWVAGQPLLRHDFMKRTFKTCINCLHPDFKHAKSGRCEDFIERILRPKGATQAHLEATDKKCDCEAFFPSAQRYTYTTAGVITAAPQRGYFEPPRFFPKILVPTEEELEQERY